MPRNPTKRVHTSTDLSPSERAPMEGGSLGVPSKGPGASHEQQLNRPHDRIANGLPVASAGQMTSPPRGPEARAKRYTVVGGPYPVMYGGQRTYLRPGKEVTDATYDIPLLKRQGVKLEAVVEEEPAPPPPPPPELETGAEGAAATATA